MGFGSFLKKAAPWIGTVIGSVPGAAPFVGIASKLLSAGLGKTVNPTQQSIADAISEAMQSPEQLAKLKEIDNQFGEQMKLLDIQSAEQFEQIAADDRANARAMQVQVKSKLPAALAIAAVAMLTGCIALLGFVNLPATGRDAILILLGAVVASYKDVYGYFFGSSAGSDRKTEILANGNGH